MVRSLYHQLKSKEPLLFKLGLTHFLFFGLLLVFGFLDDRIVTGVNIWFKPMKFALSIGVYLWTVGLYLTVLPGVTLRSVLRWVFAITMIVEIVLITMQSVRGVGSHFNFATSFDSFVFGMMGMFIYTNTVFMVLFLFWMLFRRMQKISLNMQAGLVLGLFMGVVGAYMGHVLVLNVGHAVSAPEDGPGLFFLNWSTTGGDFRVGHFMALHGLQMLPVLAWFYEKKVHSRYAIGLTIISGIMYFSYVLFIYLQARSGEPFITG